MGKVSLSLFPLQLMILYTSCRKQTLHAKSTKQMNLITAIYVIFIDLLFGVFSRLSNTDEANLITVFLSVAMAPGVILSAIKKDFTFNLDG